MEHEFDWQGPLRAAQILAEHVSEEAKILDAGAGTGLAGQVLYESGFHNLVAIDLSRGMLEEALQKDVYRELHQMIMGEPLDFDDGAFDAAISVGVFTRGHAPPSSFDELIRITRPGGYIVFTLPPDLYAEGEFGEKQSDQESQVKWKLVQVSGRYQPLPKREPELYHQVWAYQVSQ